MCQTNLCVREGLIEAGDVGQSLGVAEAGRGHGGRLDDEKRKSRRIKRGKERKEKMVLVEWVGGEHKIVRRLPRGAVV